MPLADPRRQRNPVATTLRDAVVLLAVLAIGTTVQISFERLPPTRGDGAQLSSAPQVRQVRPAEVEIDRPAVAPEAAVLPAETERSRRRSAVRADRAGSAAGPAIDRGVNVEIPAIATGAWKLLGAERP